MYNILITGASSGLGRGLAIEFANQNINLFITGRNKKRLEETAKLCKNKGANVVSKTLNIQDKKNLETWILECDDLKNIDLIIANAGISGETSNNDTYEIFNTNIFGVLNTIEPLIPRMIDRRKGQIILISSMSSFFGMASCPAYSSSKACISAYGEALRGYLKQYNIKVSTVCPGFIKTPLTNKNNFKMPFLMSVEESTKIIKKGILKNKGLIVFPFRIYFILKLLKILPYSLSNFIFSKLPKK
jgi:short-subunit dehydrogenase